jgi:hypothetical protein
MIPVETSVRDGRFRVVLDPEGKQYDLYEQNNSCLVD